MPGACSAARLAHRTQPLREPQVLLRKTATASAQQFAFLHGSLPYPTLQSTAALPVLLMTGGSLGAQSVNACLRACLPALLPHMDVLHLCGRGNLDQSLQATPGYCQLAFLGDEMPDALAAADIVLSRAGSNTLSELLALGKPMLLVPYPLGASRGDQIKNAESYQKRGLARVLAQEQMNPETMTAAVMDLLENRDALRAAVEAYPVKDGTDAVLAMIEEVQTRRGRG